MKGPIVHSCPLFVTLICAHSILALTFLVASALHVVQVWTSTKVCLKNRRRGPFMTSVDSVVCPFSPLELRLVSLASPSKKALFDIETLEDLESEAFLLLQQLLGNKAFLKVWIGVYLRRAKTWFWAVVAFSWSLLGNFGCHPVKNSPVGSCSYWSMEFKFEP